jgi:hypothetical protein
MITKSEKESNARRQKAKTILMHNHRNEYLKILKVLLNKSRKVKLK